MSTEVSDEDLANVATVSAGNNEEIGRLVSGALERVGRQGRAKRDYPLCITSCDVTFQER